MPALRAEEPKRINVAINGDMLAAIDMVIDREGVTLTEAVRRLVMYGEFLYRSVKVEGARVSVEVDGSTRVVEMV